MFVESEAFLEGVARSLSELRMSGWARLSDPLLQDARNPDSVWRPASWLEVLAPVATFLRQAIIKFRHCATQSAMQHAVEAAMLSFQHCATQSAMQHAVTALTFTDGATACGPSDLSRRLLQ